MPTFEENKNVTFTPEQASTHIAALITHKKRMERKLEHLDMRIAESRGNGEFAMVLKLTEAKKQRLLKIAATEKEIERMQKIFGDKANGKSTN